MDIAKVAKRDKTAIIVTDYNNQQWVKTIGAIYKLEGLPEMTSDDFLNLLGVPENKKEKWISRDEEDVRGLTKADRLGEVELTADPAGISIFYNGMYLTPFYVADGIMWMDEELLEPIRKMDRTYLRFFLRGKKGSRMLAVKDGLILVAVISPVLMEEDLLEKVEKMYLQCRKDMEGVEKYENGDDDLYNGEGTKKSEAEPTDAGHGGED